MNIFSNIKLLALMVLWLAISVTPLAGWLEADIRLHMLIQLPLLAATGYWSVRSWGTRQIDHDVTLAGYSSVIIASVATLYWMIPRSLDAALSYEVFRYLKYISIPLLVGVPLAHGWHRVSPIFRGFIIIELLAMLLRLGWLYRDSPIRLCSNYGLYEQNALGNYLLLIAIALSFYWAARCFYPGNAGTAYALNSAKT